MQLVHKARKARRVHKAIPDRKVTRVLLVFKGHRVLPALLARKAT